MNYQNKSIFYIPIQFSDYNKTVTCFNNDESWEKAKTPSPSYLLPYVTKIAKSPEYYQCFEKKNINASELYIYKNWLESQFNLHINPTLEKIRFSCFATNIAFLEYWFAFEDGDVVSDMLNFAYWFKRAKPKNEWLDQGTKSLFDYSLDIMPAGINMKMFFTSEKVFKYDCKCFHTVKVSGKYSQEELDDLLHRLSRNYNFSFASALDESEHDLIYKPYSYDIWCGSPDAMANVVLYEDKDRNLNFINGHKYDQILSDHHFMYLFLLNQRFSLLKYLSAVSENDTGSRKSLDNIIKESVKFKTTFSFRVVSDDLLYQSIYSKMYHILSLDQLIEDTLENEKQAEFELSKNKSRTEDNLSVLLLGLSFLSLFSALTDATSFFDRVNIQNNISTLISILCVLIIFLICCYKIFIDNK